MQPILSLFSFRGRARRTTYGIFFAVTVVTYFVLSLPFSVWSIQRDPEKIIEQLRQTSPEGLRVIDWMVNIPHGLVTGSLVFSGVVVLILYIVWIATCVRRLHDMNVTGLLVMLVIIVALFPLLGYLLVSLVLGLWPGTKGTNRYGADPRDPGAVADVFGHARRDVF